MADPSTSRLTLRPFDHQPDAAPVRQGHPGIDRGSSLSSATKDGQTHSIKDRPRVPNQGHKATSRRTRKQVRNGPPGEPGAELACDVDRDPSAEQRPKENSAGTAFGDLLRSVRTASHLSIVELARDAGCSHAIVSRYEAGEAVPKRESAARIVRALTERVSKVGGTVYGIDARTARADGIRLHMALDSSDGLLPGVRAPMSKFVSRLSLDDVQRCILGVDNIERDRELIAVIAKCVQSSKHFRILFRDKVGWQAFRSALLQEPGCAQVCLTRVKAYVVRSDVQSIVFAPNFAICELVGDRTLGAWLHRVNAATSFVDSCEGMDEGSVARVFEAIVRQLLIANTTDLGFLSPVDQ